MIEARTPVPLPKRTFYAVSALTWVSGTAWLWYRYYGQGADELGAVAVPAQTFLMKVHGAAAMGSLLVLGAVLAQHVPVGWRTGRERLTGAALLAAFGSLVVTGWALYYLGDDRWRGAASTAHVLVGVLLPLAVAVHAWRSWLRSSRGEPA